MSESFGRRLFLVSAAEITTVLGGVVLALALFGIGAYVGTLRSDLSGTLERVVSAIDAPAAKRDARIAGALTASRYPRSSVVVLLIDTQRRVDVWQPQQRAIAPVVDVRPRGEAGGEPHASGALGQVVVGLVTALGLRPLRAHVGSIDVIVRANDAALVSTVTSFVPELLAAFALSLALGIALARAITLQVVRPLVDVTSALERFASGDLTPQPIAADPHEQLGPLAIAFNGAVAQMERAFDERDRANAAMRQFIADAGHQLRTPLTVVRGFIAILRKGDLRTPEDRDRILETMNRQSHVMGSLIEKLMLLDRWESRDAAAEPIEIAQLVEDVVGPIAEAEPSRVVRLDAAPAGLASIDPTDLAYALTNIVDNALKYSRGTIDVRVARADGRIEITIRDEGPGMTPDERRHAFDRFYRGSRRDVEGSGLGLAIARRAIERAGGTLELESDPAHGSQFTIVLRAAGAAVPVAAAGPLSGAATPERRSTS